MSERALGDMTAAELARFDFFVADADGRVVLNEINTMPGLTEHSQVPRMFAAVGITYAQLIDTLVQAALSRANRVTAGGDETIARAHSANPDRTGGSR